MELSYSDLEPVLHTEDYAAVPDIVDVESWKRFVVAQYLAGNYDCFNDVVEKLRQSNAYVSDLLLSIWAKCLKVEEDLDPDLKIRNLIKSHTELVFAPKYNGIAYEDKRRVFKAIAEGLNPDVLFANQPDLLVFSRAVVGDTLNR